MDWSFDPPRAGTLAVPAPTLAEEVGPAMMTMRAVRPVALALVCLLGPAGLPGCGEGPSTAPNLGTAEFDAAKKEYRSIREMEYGRPMDPGKGKGKAAARK